MSTEAASAAQQDEFFESGQHRKWDREGLASMSAIPHYLLVILGFAFFIKGAGYLVDGASSIAP